MHVPDRLMLSIRVKVMDQKHASEANTSDSSFLNQAFSLELSSIGVSRDTPALCSWS
jgi:hypothetical protein